MSIFGQRDNSPGEEVSLGECLDKIEKFINENVITEINMADRTMNWNALIKTDGKNNPVIPVVKYTTEILILLRNLLEAYLEDIECERDNTYRKTIENLQNYLKDGINAASKNCSAVNTCLLTKEYASYQDYLMRLMGDLHQIVSYFPKIKNFPNIESLSGARKQLNNLETKALLELIDK